MVKQTSEQLRTQRAFRAILDAFANPGSLHQIPVDHTASSRNEIDLDKPLELLARIFIDQAVTFSVAGKHRIALSSYLTEETHARSVETPDAAFVIIPSHVDTKTRLESIIAARSGTLASPEKGATVLMSCKQLSETATELNGMHLIRISGPGVKEVQRFAVDCADWTRARSKRGDEFPCGIEIVLVDAEGNVVAIPRSTTILEVE